MLHRYRNTPKMNKSVSCHKETCLDLLISFIEAHQENLYGFIVSRFERSSLYTLYSQKLFKGFWVLDYLTSLLTKKKYFLHNYHSNLQGSNKYYRCLLCITVSNVRQEDEFQFIHSRLSIWLNPQVQTTIAFYRLSFYSTDLR